MIASLLEVEWYLYSEFIEAFNNIPIPKYRTPRYLY